MADDWIGRDRAETYPDNICIHLGVIAAEQVLVGQNAAGAGSELDQATLLAAIIDRLLGMKRELALMARRHRRAEDRFVTASRD